MPQRRLLTPGPTQVPEAARLSLARQVGHHRTSEFRGVLADVLAGLQDVLQTGSDIAILAASGTGAMEAAVVNLVPRGAKAIVLEAGVFARRWAEIGQAYGMNVVRHETPWGQAVDAADVGRLLAAHPDAVAVFGTLMESSTGVAHDVQAIGRVVAPTSAVFVVDAISGAGCVECRSDAWGLDVVVVGSQKALMLPPGLAFVSVGPKAWAQIERTPVQSYYFDLRRYRAKLHGPSGQAPDTPFTPAHTLVAALAETLREIRGEGIERVWARCNALAAATRAGMAALGLAVFAARPAAGMTAVKFPAGIDGAKFLARLEARFGIKLAGGQDRLKGQIFRLAHFGLIDEFDILGSLAAIELVLAEFAHPVQPGSAVAAAGRVLQEFAGRQPQSDKNS